MASVKEDVLSVTGKTLGENIKDKKVLNYDVIRPVDNPYSKTGGIAILFGSLAPNGGVVKRSAVAPEMLKHEGPARVFESEEQAMELLKAVSQPVSEEKKSSTQWSCVYNQQDAGVEIAMNMDYEKVYTFGL